MIGKNRLAKRAICGWRDGPGCDGLAVRAFSCTPTMARDLESVRSRRQKRHAALASRWLRLMGDSLKPLERLQFSKEIASATEKLATGPELACRHLGAALPASVHASRRSPQRRLSLQRLVRWTSPRSWRSPIQTKLVQSRRRHRRPKACQKVKP